MGIWDMSKENEIQFYNVCEHEYLNSKLGNGKMETGKGKNEMGNCVIVFLGDAILFQLVQTNIKSH